ncbi:MULTISPECIES: acyl-CoA desaturase [Rubrivivax]|uniref:Acyl-CoA desaturase n=1 Tax=Rubrivivax benzoatilyticus TaxID=316997 RepID=A0ABX0HXK8_9BURK|nr:MULTISPECIES: acyl-CoA desaturase [Rubrivivax]MCD0417708.1 fatty acid desaturase [Rubrivivax sp. JA1024]MCC9598184.1 fatty acid desaturase [Rubrivivax sp. JA1055]MCC9645560.1 fatty acid desaturase [Rubrivivax sp. JA1029]NHK99145.1 acyl-CoA desaturase [Rubrivivax benzoatilyticus]NHL24992.1 acyl-CoA desaturase [Rubrivivax benzoatilyticus]
MTQLLTFHDVLVDGLAHGLLGASWWQIVLFTLVVTHVTIAAVTIFLHRSQAHRALDLHPVVSHFFRFWLWLTTGMVTKEWVAIHRKHHAKCETEEDPHSPVTRGIKTVLLTGSELYRAEAKVGETLKKYGHGTPDDWIERHLYSRFSWQGVALMLIVDLLLFGAVGATVWAVQMLWIPIHAAGIINGIGHFWGYRNFEAADASTNISPWGILIGGEELHNNHHTYPTSAKFSVKRYEFDIGWVYIRGMQTLGLAKVRKTPPRLALGELKPVADGQTLDALIANRYEVMAGYAKEMRRAVRAELARLKAQGAQNSAHWRHLVLAKTWLHRDEDKIPHGVRPQLSQALGDNPSLAKLVAMREELRALWTRTNVSADQLVADLQAWCRKAEDSGIAALQEFSLKLRSARA